MTDTRESIQVRAMQPHEKGPVKSILRRAFSPIQCLFFSWKGHTLVAQRDGRLLGAAVLDVFPLPDGRQGGIVLWIFTDPSVHGQGAGQALAEAAIAYFESEGCTDMFACVEGYNTSSSTLFATRGFGILSPGAQLRRYGWGVFTMWLHTSHIIDVGHFLWARPPADRSDSPALQWWGVLLANTVLVWLALWRQNGFGAFDARFLAIAPICLLLFFGVRTLAMLWAARAQRIDLRYRAWESGFPLGVVIALVLGGLYPNPGNLYPAADRWRYRDWIPKLGPVALAGVLPTTLICWALWALGRYGALSPDAALWRSVAMMIGVMLGILDVITVFFPLASYNGRRVWDWKPWLWAVIAVSIVGVILL